MITRFLRRITQPDEEIIDAEIIEDVPPVKPDKYLFGCKSSDEEAGYAMAMAMFDPDNYE